MEMPGTAEYGVGYNCYTCMFANEPINDLILDAVAVKGTRHPQHRVITLWATGFDPSWSSLCRLEFFWYKSRRALTCTYFLR